MIKLDEATMEKIYRHETPAKVGEAIAYLNEHGLEEASSYIDAILEAKKPLSLAKAIALLQEYGLATTHAEVEPFIRAREPYIAANTLISLLPDNSWSFLGMGTYNVAFLSKEDITIEDETTGVCYTGLCVLKISAHIAAGTLSERLSSPDRALRIWREINPELPVTKHGSNGWIAPYISGTKEFSDKKRAETVEDIYCNTGRVLADGEIRGNLILGEGGEGEKGEERLAYCVDVDWALRPGSPVSTESVEKFSKGVIRSLSEHQPASPKTVNTILGLLETSGLWSKQPETAAKQAKTTTRRRQKGPRRKVRRPLMMEQATVTTVTTTSSTCGQGGLSH